MYGEGVTSRSDQVSGESTEVVWDAVDEVVAFWRRENADLDPITKQIAMRFRRGAQAIERGLRQELASVGVDEVWEIEVLLTLRREVDRDCCVRDLTREARVTSGAMTNRIDRLERRGWVTRSANPQDRRQVRVRLTPEGVARADHIIATKLELEARLFAGVDREVLDRLAGDLRTVLTAMEQAVDGEDSVVAAP